MSFYSGIFTLIAGIIVFFVYLKQKSDEKIQIARLLLTEIRIIEKRIDEIKEKISKGDSQNLPKVFSTKNWNNYAFMFINDFDQDELNLLNDLYYYGEIIEENIRKTQNFFWIATEERSKLQIQKLGEFINPPNKEDIVTKYKEFDDKMSKILTDCGGAYIPTRGSDEIKFYLPKISKITTSSVGTKLKKIAKMN